MFAQLNSVQAAFLQQETPQICSLGCTVLSQSVLYS